MSASERFFGFANVDYRPKQIELYLDVLLYRGASQIHSRAVRELLEQGHFGKPLQPRWSLVERIHQYLNGELVAGGSAATLRRSVGAIRDFYAYADALEVDLDDSNAVAVFRDYISNQYDSSKTDVTVFGTGTSLAKVLASALGVNRTAVVAGTRLRWRSDSPYALGNQADKASISDVLAFGRVLLDLINALSIEACTGDIPIRINIPSIGRELQHWLGMSPAEKLPTASDPAAYSASVIRASAERREMRSKNTSLNVRHPIINLRLQAEYLLFISQTGMNPSQVRSLTMGDFRYETADGGYRVRKYKSRRRGEVEFEIFSEYRAHFEKYLQFRSSVVGPERDALFVYLGQAGADWNGQLDPIYLKRFLSKNGLPFQTARTLRNARQNWLIRRTDNPALVAGMGQHTVDTLIRTYEKPSHHRSALEWSRFFDQFESTVISTAPGRCNGDPSPRPSRSLSAAEPDCINPAGCVFCAQYRGSDTLDFVWSLLSYRALKATELALDRLNVNHQPSAGMTTVIEKLTEIADAYRSRSKTNADRYEVAKAWIRQENFHPRWAGFITLAGALI